MRPGGCLLILTTGLLFLCFDARIFTTRGLAINVGRNKLNIHFD
jgi:hypothetical protein